MASTAARPPEINRICERDHSLRKGGSAAVAIMASFAPLSGWKYSIQFNTPVLP
jgi:hypothetical protein